MVLFVAGELRISMTSPRAIFFFNLLKMPAILLHQSSIFGVLRTPSPGEVLRKRPGVFSTHGDTQNNLPALLLHPFSGNATCASQGNSEPV